MAPTNRIPILAVAAAAMFTCASAPAQQKTDAGKPAIVQARAVLTVSEGKRLIGKAVAQMPVVKKALRDGMVIIGRGTTNTYVAEEILGKRIAHGAFVTGRVYPAKGGKRLPRLKRAQRMSEIVIINGKVAPDLAFADAVKKLKPGDVVIKGANLLDYPNKTAGVLIGARNSGTTGAFMPYLVAGKAHLVIPIGLEKQGSGDVLDVQRKMRQPIESLNRVPSMFLMTGSIVTEIEALKILADVSAFQAAAGGIGGAEGAIWLVFRGEKPKVEKALKVVAEVQGEPPFVQ